MKTKIIPIIALLVLATIMLIPADKIKMPNFGKLKSAFGIGNTQSYNSNGFGRLGGINGRGEEARGPAIQYLNEKIKNSQIRPSRHDENDLWSYDNKSYQKVDRDYRLDISDDLKLENKNIRGLLGRSKVDVNLYNKGLFNSGYGNVEVLIIAYDEYGDYLGERIEVMSHCICKSENSGERLGISRNTDEVIVKILHAEPCTCRDWYEKANRKKEKEQKRVNDDLKREKEKQYKQWEKQNSRENKNDYRRNTYDNSKTSNNDYSKTSNNDYSKTSNRKTSYNRDWQQPVYDREIQSKNKPLFGRNKSNKQSKVKKVVYYEDYDEYDDGYYEEPKQKRQKKEKAYKEEKPSKQKGIPDDVQIRERGPIHVEFCDCRKCRYDHQGPNYEFSKKTY